MIFLLQRKKDGKFIDKDILAEAEYYFKNGRPLIYGIHATIVIGY